MKKLQFAAVSLAIIAIAAMSTACATSNIPKSHQALFVESTNSKEVMVRATGNGGNNEEAVNDARRAAVEFIITGGSNPLLTKPEELSSFGTVSEEFFKLSNVMGFIVWEDDAYKSRLKTSEGYIRIEKIFKLNKQKIQDALVARGVSKSRDELTASAGNPTIMVMPNEVAENLPKLDLNKMENFALKPQYEHANVSVQQFLTSRGYDVLVFGQNMQLNSSILGIAGGAPNLLGLAIGADVYISYSVTVDKSSEGGSRILKASVSVKAFETTTARLVGAATGYSAPRATSSSDVVVKEAMNDAVDKVLNDINQYWKDDIKKGNHFKVVVYGSFTGDDGEAAARKVKKALREVSKNVKQVSDSGSLIDYIVWGKQKDGGDLYDEMKDAIKGVKLNKKSIVGKFLILDSKVAKSSDD